MYHYNTMMYSPFHFLGSLISVVFWIFIVILIIKLLRRRKHMNEDWGGWWRGGSALHTLRERYAKGEINKEEFEERKKVLQEK